MAGLYSESPTVRFFTLFTLAYFIAYRSVKQINFVDLQRLGELKILSLGDRRILTNDSQNFPVKIHLRKCG